MNSEKRHELQQNVLANYLGDVLKKIEPHTKSIAVVIVAIVGSAVAYGLFLNSKTEAKSDATLELLQNASSGDAEALAGVGDRYANTVAGTMARLYEADTNLGAGITALFSDRDEAESRIEDAIKAYKTVILSAKGSLLTSRANFGLARAYESLGQTKEAIAAYEATASLTESEAVAEAAKQRIALLQKAETQEFLTWFAKQDFKPADPTTPPNFPDGQRLPDLPDLDLPSIAPMDVPDELKTTSDAEAKPAPGEISLPPAVAAVSETRDVPETELSNEVELEMPKQAEKPAAPVVEIPATETPVATVTEIPAPATETPVAPATETPVAEGALPKTESTPPTDATSSAGDSSKVFVGDNAAERVTDEK